MPGIFLISGAYETCSKYNRIINGEENRSNLMAKQIALALGGGGSKGNAHIGVLRILERAGIYIAAIAGTSAGGMVGALYAAGYSPDEIEESLHQVDQDSLFHREPGEGPGMMGLLGVRHLYQEKLGTLTFDQLHIPFAVTATDLDGGRSVHIHTGRVFDAVMATIAVPGVFPPAMWGGLTLVDGGVLDPVPVQLARSLAPWLPVAAVVLSPKLEEWDGPANPRLLNTLPFLSTYVARLRIAQAFNIFLRSVDIAGAQMTEMRLQLDHPDVIIRPEVGQIGLLDRVNVHQVVELGEQAATAALTDIERAVSWRGWLDRRTGWAVSRLNTGNG